MIRQVESQCAVDRSKNSSEIAPNGRFRSGVNVRRQLCDRFISPYCVFLDRSGYSHLAFLPTNDRSTRTIDPSCQQAARAIIVSNSVRRPASHSRYRRSPRLSVRRRPASLWTQAARPRRPSRGGGVVRQSLVVVERPPAVVCRRSVVSSSSRLPWRLSAPSLLEKRAPFAAPPRPLSRPLSRLSARAT